MMFGKLKKAVLFLLLLVVSEGTWAAKEPAASSQYNPLIPMEETEVLAQVSILSPIQMTLSNEKYVVPYMDAFQGFPSVQLGLSRPLLLQVQPEGRR